MKALTAERLEKLLAKEIERLKRKEAACRLLPATAGL